MQATREEVSNKINQYNENYIGTLSGEKLEKFKHMVEKQRKLGYDANVSKNIIFTAREEIDRIDQPIEKYRSNMFHSISNAKKAVRFSDEIQVQFLSRDLYSDLEADCLTNMYEFDYDTLKRDILEYYQLDDIDRYGCAIEVATHWDDIQKSMSTKRIHPRSMFPDPQGYGTINNFRFIGFETLISKEELFEMDIANKEQVQMMISGMQQNIIQEEKINRGINPGYNQKNGMCTIYNHYCFQDGKPVVSRWFEDILLDIKQLAVLSDEKGRKYKFPVIIYYEDPDIRDPRGRSLWDTIEDKMRLETLLVNLFKIKAIRQAMGGKIFMDVDAFNTNIDVLKQQTLQNQYYPIRRNTNESIDSLVYEMKEQQIGPDFYNLLNDVRSRAERETSIDALAQGVADPNISTATESNVKQANANLLQSLTDKVIGRGKEQKARLYYAYVKHYFSQKDKKFIRLNKGITQPREIITRRNIIGYEDPDIKVVNMSIQRAKNESDLPRLVEHLNLLLTDPNTPAFALRIIKRIIARKQGFKIQEIEQIHPRTPDELETKDEVILLSKNIPVEFTSLDNDRYMKITLYQSAVDTEAKQKAINACKQAYIMTGQNKMQQQNMITDTGAMGGMGRQIVESTGNQVRQNSVNRNQVLPQQ